LGYNSTIIVLTYSAPFPSFKAFLIAPLIIVFVLASIPSIEIVAIAKIYILLMLACADLRPLGLKI
jgi:hypothetical protein